MSSANSMALYRELLPKLSMPGKRRKYDESDLAYTFTKQLDTVTIFDCRSLPSAFVDDTGDAVYDELEQTKSIIHLPFTNCYFEFADEPRMIYVGEVSLRAMTEIAPGATLIDRTVYIGHEFEVFDLSINTTFDGVGCNFRFGEPPHGDRYQFYSMVNPRKRENQAHWDKVGRRALAVATLLNEKLVIDKVRPDPAPGVTHERLRTHKPPISGEAHVLTINVPIIRYRTARSTPQGETHDSPALHWRRGHWRVYNRGSNFESTGWVQRCLVGDPAKGYIRNTQYRLVHRPAPFRIINGGRAA